MNNVAAAIERSLRQNEIVTIDYSDEAEAELLAACDDSAESSYDRGPDSPPGTLTEYWGSDRDGDAWRVHMRSE